MQMRKKSTIYLEWVLIALIVVQIIFFFAPIYELSVGIKYFKFIEYTFGLYSMAFGMNYGLWSMSGSLLWLTMLALPILALLLVICARKNRLIRYGLPGFISLTELIGLKIIFSKINEEVQLLLTLIRSSEIMQALEYGLGTGSADEMMSYIFAYASKTNLCYLYLFVMLATVVAAVALIVSNLGLVQSDMNEIIQTANNSAVKMQSVINAYNNTKICQNCGSSISRDADFCPKCGAKYVAPAAKVCPSCGAILNEDSLFCTKCGQPVNVEHGFESESESKSKSRLENEAELVPVPESNEPTEE